MNSALTFECNFFHPQIETDKLFNNIGDISMANGDFWSHYLIRVLEESRNTAAPLNPSLMKEGFQKVNSNRYKKINVWVCIVYGVHVNYLQLWGTITWSLIKFLIHVKNVCLHECGMEFHLVSHKLVCFSFILFHVV